MATITNILCGSGVNNNNLSVGLQNPAGIIHIGDENVGFTRIIMGNQLNNTGITLNAGESGDITANVHTNGQFTINGYLVVNTTIIDLAITTANTLITIGNTSGTTEVDILAGTGKVNITSPTATNFSSGITTKPVASSTATTAYGSTLTLGTSLRNTTGYDILVNISIAITAATSATLVMGVGSTSTPTTNTVIPSFTVAAFTPFNFTAIVPNTYYLLVDSTGTPTVGSVTLQVCPL